MARRGKAKQDPELQAIERMITILDRLDEGQCQRVLAFLAHRYHVAPSLRSARSAGVRATGANLDEWIRASASLRTCLEAIETERRLNGSERALLAALFLKVYGDRDEFTTRDIATELAGAGCPGGNVSAILEQMTQRKEPPLERADKGQKGTRRSGKNPATALSAYLGRRAIRASAVDRGPFSRRNAVMRPTTGPFMAW